MSIFLEMKLKSQFVLLLLFAFYFSGEVFSQDLMSEKIRKIPQRKKAIYLTEGVIHHPQGPKNTILKNIRHSFSSQTGFERVVFDFDGQEIPQVYGQISWKEGKLNLDFFETNLSPSVSLSGGATYLKGIAFFPVGKEFLSVELELKEKKGMDIFSLSNPARLVIDIK